MTTVLAVNTSYNLYLDHLPDLHVQTCIDVSSAVAIGNGTNVSIFFGEMGEEFVSTPNTTTPYANKQFSH